MTENTAKAPDEVKPALAVVRKKSSPHRELEAAKKSFHEENLFHRHRLRPPWPHPSCPLPRGRRHPRPSGKT